MINFKRAKLLCALLLVILLKGGTVYSSELIEQQKLEASLMKTIRSKWRNQNEHLMTRGLQILKETNINSTSKENLIRFIKRLTLLPINDKHYADITDLLESNNPYHQEAGVHFVNVLCNDAKSIKEFEPMLCNILEQKEIESRVLQAIYEFTRSIRIGVGLPKFYSQLTKVVFLGDYSTNVLNLEHEQMAQTIINIQQLLMSHVLSCSEPENPDIRAIRNVLESVFKVNDYDELLNILNELKPKYSFLNWSRTRYVIGEGWDERSNKWYHEWQTINSQLLTEVLQQIENEESWSGDLSDFIELLQTLPFEEQHLQYVKQIIVKDVPYMQEAGILLAGAMLGQENLRNRELVVQQLEQSFCKLLQKSSIDPWVILSLTDYVLNNDASKIGMKKIYINFITLIENPVSLKRGLEEFRIRRTRPICGNINVNSRIIIETVLADDNKPHFNSFIKHLERRLGVKGIKEIKAKLFKKLDLIYLPIGRSSAHF